MSRLPKLKTFPLALFQALAFTLLTVPLWAQGTTGSIRGVVRDANGPVAGAAVSALGEGTGFRRSTMTDANGLYTLPGLTPGVYELTVTSDAAGTVSRRVQLLVGQEGNADFDLAPSETVAEEISVTGVSPELLIDTRSSAISTNITPDQIEHLPQNNRNFLSFAGLAPGVAYTDNMGFAVPMLPT